MTAGTRRALVIGIDEYPNFEPGHRLFGAVADARAMADWLVKTRGFRDVELLLDAEARRDEILEAMDGLRRRLGPRDQVVFFFSGHGSQMTDREGDEGDGLDETLVSWDSGRAPDENRDLSDDEMHAWASEILSITPDLVLIFDCCHSATLHRPGWRARSLPPDLRPISELPPSPVPATVARDVRVGPEPVKLSACGDLERALEIPPDLADGHVRGAFTFHLLRALDRAAPGTTWHQVMEAVAGSLVEARVDQRPEGSGHGYDRPILSRPEPRRRTQVERLAELLDRRTEDDSLRVDVFRSVDGPWIPVQPGDGFREGDRLRVDVLHRHGRGLYVYVLDLGLTGSLDLVFPDRHGHEPVDPGLRLRIGARPEDELELYLPADFPKNEPSGEGRLLVVASETRLSTARLLAWDDTLWQGPLRQVTDGILLRSIPYRLCR